MKGRPGTTHGTHRMYAYYKCRCDECIAFHRAYQEAWKAKHSDRLNGYAKKHREKDPERTAAMRRAHYEANRERNLRIAREWAAANPEKIREQGRRKAAKRRAIQRDVPARHITDREWSRLCNRHDNRCAYCGERKLLTMDHVVPITRGGQHAIGNLVPACLSCNSSKGTRLIVEWLKRGVAA